MAMFPLLLYSLHACVSSSGVELLLDEMRASKPISLIALEPVYSVEMPAAELCSDRSRTLSATPDSRVRDDSGEMKGLSTRTVKTM